MLTIRLLTKKLLEALDLRVDFSRDVVEVDSPPAKSFAQAGLAEERPPPTVLEGQPRRSNGAREDVELPKGMPSVRFKCKPSGSCAWRALCTAAGVRSQLTRREALLTRPKRGQRFWGAHSRSWQASK